MERNSYYTPSIEEFHVGFEFEIKSSKEEWAETLFSGADSAKLATILLSEQRIRVKCLDREDIESLGWSFWGTGTWNSDKFTLHIPMSKNERDGYHLTYYLRHWGGGDISIKLVERGGFSGLEENEKFKVSFKVKNISELRRLMKMVGITK